MSRSFQKGPQGVRGDRQSGSKVSNLTPFQPFYSATEKVYNKYYDRFKNRTLPLIKIEPTHEDFIFPVSMHDIDSQLKKIPRQFTEGVKAVLVPTGSKKQITVMKSLLQFGEYWEECIFLHPYPKELMVQRYSKKPNPHIIQGYKQAGAVVVSKGTGIEISFNETSLQRFFLYDVLMHEIGHHNAKLRGNDSRKKREGFANWFASEYGYRLRSTER